MHDRSVNERPQRWMVLSAAVVVGVALFLDPEAAGGVAAQERGPDIPATAPRVSEYEIGPGDQLELTFWREEDLSGEVLVRPDGHISVPLLHDVLAAGLTPVELQSRLTSLAKRFVDDPIVTVAVTEINSRWVYITGLVERAGSYSLVGPTTILQLIATAGGLAEFADSSNIVLLRTVGNPPIYVSHQFNYDQVTRGSRLDQNIELRPGDTVVVP